MTASKACLLPWMSEAMAMRMRTVFSVRRTLGLPIALVAAVAVAEGAVLLFRPRDLGPAPVPVEARAYFSSAQLEKAVAFRSGSCGCTAHRS
jgi:hypothetical protein